MAEERLIDTDKDKKYSIKINEDGEEELYIAEQEALEEEDVSFEVPENFVEDEEFAVLTPEQYERALRAKQEEEAKQKQRFLTLLADAKDSLAQEKFVGALDYLQSAEEIDEENGELYSLQLCAVTQNFTDFDNTDLIVHAAEGMQEYATDEQKQALYQTYGAGIEREYRAQAKALEELSARYEKERAARAEILLPRRRNAAILFGVATLAFIGLLIGAILCGIKIHTDLSGGYMTATLILGIAAGVAFIADVFAARAFVSSMRLVAANNRDSSTKTGREYADLKEKCDTLNAVVDAVGGDK